MIGFFIAVIEWKFSLDVIEESRVLLRKWSRRETGSWSREWIVIIESLELRKTSLVSSSSPNHHCWLPVKSSWLTLLICKQLMWSGDLQKKANEFECLRDQVGSSRFQRWTKKRKITSQSRRIWLKKKTQKAPSWQKSLLKQNFALSKWTLWRRRRLKKIANRRKLIGIK